MKTTFILMIALLSLFALSSVILGQGSDASPAQIPENIKTIIKQNCSVSGCHSGKTPAAGHNFELNKFVAAVVNVPSLEVPDLKIVDVSAPEKSYLLAKIKGEPGIVGKHMPANRDPLTEEQIQQIEEWIKSMGTGPSKADASPDAGRADVSFNPSSSDRGPALDSLPIAGHSPGQASSPKGFSKPAFWGTRLINLP